jgi:hypothetical protein
MLVSHHTSRKWIIRVGHTTTEVAVHRKFQKFTGLT